MDKKAKNKLFAQIGGQFAIGGLIAGAVFFGAIGYVAVPYWFGKTVVPTESQQIGFRGTAMEVVRYESDIAALAEANAFEPYFETPYVPEEGEELMQDIDFYENVQVLGHLTEANFTRLMGAITEWVAPEVGCAYCHAEGEPMSSDSLYTKRVARSMIQMTWAINEGWTDHVNGIDDMGQGVTCYTCHRGNNVPEYVWYEPEVVNEYVGGTAAYSNRGGNPLVGYADLPVTAVRDYLLNYEPISVSSFAPREPSEGTADIKKTESTFALMMHFSQSLGVNCTYCHNSRAFYDPEQVTPYHSNALLGIGMVLELNNDWITPLTAELPAERLGPMGDAPKAYCMTCHQGANQPLLGAPAAANWPELQSQTPVYEAVTATQ